MMTEPISILFSSDHHFGSHHLDQGEMAKAFADTIFPLIPETDICFLNGDFFDTLVIFDHPGFEPIYDVIMELFVLCEKHRTTLRILQGTWTHDRNQCKRFEAFYRNHHGTFDFRFMDGIQLETITIRDRELRFFYVQDNLPFASSEEIVKIIDDKRIEKGWDKIDYGCMHGFFDFTYPQNIPQGSDPVFSEKQFPFLRKMIDVGHVHQHRIVGNVCSNGSFNRLNHGDEDPKGCIKVLDYPDHYTARFIENTNAFIFHTLTFGADADTEIMRATTQAYIDTLDQSRSIFIRFIMDSNDQMEAIKTWMREVHPKIKITRKKNTDKPDGHLMIPTSSLIAPVVRRPAPTRQTIALFIRNHISEDYNLTIPEIEAYLEPRAA